MKSKNAQKNQVNFTNEFWFDHFKEKRSQIYSFLRPKHYHYFPNEILKHSSQCSVTLHFPYKKTNIALK